MKKNLFLLIVGLFVVGTSYAQMSFNGNKLKKSAFDLTEKKAGLSENNTVTHDAFSSDEENDVMKKRRRSGGRRKSRGSSGDYSNSIKLNPIGILFGVYGGQYERKISDNISLSLTVGLYSRSVGSFDYSGYTFDPEFRYYFDEAMEGLYFSSFIVFTLFTESYTDLVYDFNTSSYVSHDVSNSTSLYGLGLAGGRQWIWGGFTLDVFGGVEYLAVSGSVSSGGASFGTAPVLGISLGYSF